MLVNPPPPLFADLKSGLVSGGENGHDIRWQKRQESLFSERKKYYLSQLGRSCYAFNVLIGERKAEPPEFVPKGRLRLGTRGKRKAEPPEFVPRRSLGTRGTW
jgi:hypothetical protein